MSPTIPPLTRARATRRRHYRVRRAEPPREPQPAHESARHERAGGVMDNSVLDPKSDCHILTP